MDLKELLESITERGDRLKPPVRLRRKPKARIPKQGRYRDSEAYRLLTVECTARWRRSVSGKFVEMKKAYTRKWNKDKTKGQWLLTLAEWQEMWAAAGHITTPLGQRLLAFSYRGVRPDRVRMMRIDDKGNYELSNIVIIYQGKAIANGRALHKEQA